MEADSHKNCYSCVLGENQRFICAAALGKSLIQQEDEWNEVFAGVMFSAE